MKKSKIFKQGDTDDSIRDYLKYFATGKISSDVTWAIQSKVEFYHKDPKTRSDYMTLKDIIEDEREEARAEGREEGRTEGSFAKAREIAKGLLEDGVPINIIVKRSGFSIEEIKNL